MPRSVFFVACERAIIEEGSGNLSLVSLLQEVRAAIPSSVMADLPRDAVVQTRWYAVAFWEAQAGDGDREFEQRVTLTDPEGRIAADVRTKFKMSKRFHRTVGAVRGFPVAVPGDCQLRLGLREAGTEEDWTEVADYPLTLIHAGPPLGM
jgi:hypothetical protein